MNKIPKFLICENPILEDGRLFIMHARSPYILAEIHHFYQGEESEIMECQRQYEVGARTELEDEIIVLGAVDVLVLPGISNDEYAAIMRRMADWYKSYCIWEDENIREQ